MDFDDEIIEKDLEQRSICVKCERPSRVCWCEYLPDPPLELKRSVVLVLQHPNERKRSIRTAKMLEQGLGQHCLLFVRRKILSLDITDKLSPEEKSLRTWLSHPGTHVLFPKDNAATPQELRNLGDRHQKIILVVLDGTWNEARKMYSWSPPLQKLPKLRLEVDVRSQFVVKTQPNDQCLSTVECVAHALAVLEDSDAIIEALTKPLLALCSVQISHGAVEHDSLESKKGQIQSFVKENCRKAK